MTRLEILLVGLFFACWSIVVLGVLDLVDLAGSRPLSLYALYSMAAALGWVFGNVYVVRCREVGRRVRRRLRTFYLLGPPSIIYLLRAMAPGGEQLAAPLVPLYGFGVYCALFLVPVLLRRSLRPPGP